METGRDPADQATWIERLVGSPAVRSTYASAVAHVAILIAMALLLVPQVVRQRPLPIAVGLAFEAPPDADTGLAAESVDVARAAGPVPAPDAAALPPEPPDLGPDLAAAATPRPADPTVPGSAEPEALADETVDGDRAPPSDVADGGDPGRGIYAGRRGAERGRRALAGGGSAASEAAVERGLAWLALHQAADGSWRFDLSGCRCDGGCRDPGTIASTTAATGIALLPFLGAGHTTTEGAYRETVTRGIYYLMSRLQRTPRGGDLCEGTLYGQGVATLALAEAFGMTADPMLAGYVNDAVRFIVSSQDTHGGGWRYLPGQPGDITVTAWQLTALTSAALAGAEVPSPTIDGIRRFLDRVQVAEGAAYGYQSPHARPCTSAIGLLCRLYTSWPDADTIDRGLATLAKPGPKPEAVYLNFYLSQALLHRDHPAWRRWNPRARDQLVGRQEKRGHEAGSWAFADQDTAPGGRLAHTALAVLTLEVYYRLLPIYSAEAVARGW